VKGSLHANTARSIHWLVRDKRMDGHTTINVCRFVVQLVSTVVLPAVDKTLTDIVHCTGFLQ